MSNNEIASPVEAFSDFDLSEAFTQFKIKTLDVNEPTKAKKIRKKKWYKKTQVRKSDKPKRPLSGYNLFFQDKRQQLLESLPNREGSQPRRTHGKIDFKQLAIRISGMWNTLDEQSKQHYQTLGQKERERYYEEVENYKARQKQLENAARQETDHWSSTKIAGAAKYSAQTGIMGVTALSSDSLDPICLSQSPRSTTELASRLDPELMRHFLHIFS